MKITYELNPPKVIRGDYFDLLRLNQEMEYLSSRASSLSGFVDGIHLTDSVLGIPRVSSVTAASHIKRSGCSLNLSCSLRVRDRNLTSTSQFVCDAILVGVKSLLILIGDEPLDGPKDSGLKPSEVLNILHSKKYDTAVDLDLSIPNKIKNRSSIQKKIEARPHAFITQSIVSLSELEEIVDIAKPWGIKVVACIMAPSEKNKSSADMIGLNWKEYEKNPIDFIRQAGKIANEVLVTSPNSFTSGIDLLKELKKNC
jgi:5,10-methylenetetrahydrofolate reductase